MHNGVDALLGEEPVEEVGVRDVALVEGALADELATAGGEVIQDDHVVTCVLAGGSDGAADVSGSASDEYLHAVLS